MQNNSKGPSKLVYENLHEKLSVSKKAVNKIDDIHGIPGFNQPMLERIKKEELKCEEAVTESYTRCRAVIADNGETGKEKPDQETGKETYEQETGKETSKQEVENEFKCKHCDKSFTRKDNLKRHTDKKCKANKMDKTEKVREKTKEPNPKESQRKLEQLPNKRITEGSAGMAVLKALFNFTNENSSLSKPELKKMAQWYTKTNLTLNNRAEFITAWSSIEALTTMGYLNEQGTPAKYSLTLEARTLMQSNDKCKDVSQQPTSAALTNHVSGTGLMANPSNSCNSSSVVQAFVAAGFDQMLDPRPIKDSGHRTLENVLKKTCQERRDPSNPSVDPRPLIGALDAVDEHNFSEDIEECQVFFMQRLLDHINLLPQCLTKIEETGRCETCGRHYQKVYTFHIS